jgi:predicted DNA-binding protein with PD1-like motif
MSRIASVFFVIVMCGALAACAGTATRTELVKSTTPYDDAKPNSSAVPESMSMATAFERVVVLRFKYDADLLGGIERQVKELGIGNAVILAGIGSVRGYHVHTVSNRSFPSKNVFVADPVAPADILSVNGYVIAGRVHAHIVLADPEHSFGGHLERDTRVFTFAAVTLGVLREPVDLSRLDDKTYR